MTKSAEGAEIWDGENWIPISPFTVNAIDSTGAGDSFAGAYLFGASNGLTKAESGKLACKVSSVVVSQFGPRLEKAQMAGIKKTIGAWTSSILLIFFKYSTFALHFRNIIWLSDEEDISAIKQKAK